MNIRAIIVALASEYHPWLPHAVLALWAFAGACLVLSIVKHAF